MTENELLKYIHAVSARTGFTGTGDDAAVLSNFTTSSVVVSTDQFLEGTHFTWEHLSPKEVGYKGTIQALSDLAAMAATPKALLCSVAWPPAIADKIKLVFQGIEEACLEYKIPLVGGDISRSSQMTYIDFTVIGQSEKPALQSTAKPGDLLAVSGPIGSAAAGFRLVQMQMEGASELVSVFKKPKAQIEKALSLNGTGFLTSLTDISDGLSTSVHRLSENSKCGFTFDIEKIPRLKALTELCERLRWPLTDMLLAGGEDYQLLMTLKPETPQNVILDHGLTVIGHAHNNQNSYNEQNKNHALKEVGWDPFIL